MLLRIARLASKIANTRHTIKHMTFPCLQHSPFQCYLQFTSPKSFIRNVSTSYSGQMQQAAIEMILKRTFPKAEKIIVHDISGGCGAMFELKIITEDFRDMPKVKQHMLVNKALAAEISNMHGLRIFTAAPDNEDNAKGSNGFNS